MNGYSRFSQYYDFLTFNVDYKERAKYILSIFEGLNHDMGLSLDLACGTGTLTCELKKQGVDIYGIDASSDMLSIANEKARELELDILFLCQRMQEIDLYGTIDTCICTLDSINHLESKEDVQKTFEKVSLFMNKGGRFLFDVNTVLKHKNILGNNTFVYDTDEVYCVWQNSLLENNTIKIDLDFFEKDEDAYYRSSEGFSETAYDKEEIEKMLVGAGFAVEKVFSDMTFDDAKDDDERIVFVARKL